jgi:hypothetical protein
VALTVSGGTLVSFKTISSGVPAPHGSTFAWGQWAFTATSKPGAVVTFTFTLSSHPIGYVKLINGKWQSFTWNGTTGVKIKGDVLTLKIRDNGRGDQNAKSGIVTDPGALMIETAPAQVSTSVVTSSVTGSVTSGGGSTGGGAVAGSASSGSSSTGSTSATGGSDASTLAETGVDVAALSGLALLLMLGGCLLAVGGRRRRLTAV